MNIVKVGKSIRAIRLMRGMSQAHVAAETGLDPNYISRLEGGHRNGTLETFQKIAKVLGVNWTAMLMFSEVSEPDMQEFAPLIFKHILQGNVRVENGEPLYTWEIR